MQGQVSVAAATAVIGYDLLTGVTWAVSSRRRRLVAAGLAGSAAALGYENPAYVWHGFSLRDVQCRDRCSKPRLDDACG